MSRQWRGCAPVLIVKHTLIGQHTCINQLGEQALVLGNKILLTRVLISLSEWVGG